MSMNHWTMIYTVKLHAAPYLCTFKVYNTKFKSVQALLAML